MPLGPLAEVKWEVVERVGEKPTTRGDGGEGGRAERGIPGVRGSSAWWWRRASSRVERRQRPRTAMLAAFKQRLKLFRLTCDHAEELIESIRQRIGSECLVDKATSASSSSSFNSLASPTEQPPPQSPCDTPTAQIGRRR
uniref:Uncharacterized protein n=1 Tax=Oryza glumipatula TaxID=40148 RepID=A0A0D9ZTG3_9ORYZ